MDVNLINPFFEAISQIMPQLGFKNVSRGKLAVNEKYVYSRGVTVLIGLTRQVRGNIAYNMSEDVAKGIASTMMMGMPISELDDMAQSAIGEMVNMVTATAAINFERIGLTVDISPPSLIIGNDFKAQLSVEKISGC